MKGNLDFEQVLHQAGLGDSAAIAWLWRRHQGALVGWLRSMASVEAEDIASEAWINALRGLSRFQGDESSFRTWLFTIARRRLIDRQRREGRRPNIPTDHRMDDLDAATEAIESIEAQRAVEQINSILTPDQAEVVLLRVIGGLDVDQVADVLGKKAGTIRVLCHRGLRKLAGVMITAVELETTIEDT